MMTSANLNREIYELAEMLIARHGERAASYATHQSLKARHRGEHGMMEAWRSIATTAEHVWKIEPILPPRDK
ncbi:MAG TPA: hypothetical protein VEI03_13725 [Stellaceae bacterium]|nr:hypothetical protein [Stellaceae bacterium]